jgi:cell division protein FtsA
VGQVLARKGEIVGAVDFGSRSVRVLIARQNADGGIQILGHGVAPGRGAVNQGVIQDLSAAQAALKKALSDAEKSAGVRAPSLFCGVNGKNVDTFIREGHVKLDKEVVELANLEDALDQASRDILASGKRVLSSITSQEWYVDELRVQDPVGIRGGVLKVRVHFAQLPSLIEDNLINCVESQGRELEDIVFMPLAAGLGCLTPEDMELGVAVLDMGRTNTGLILYHDRRIVATNCFEFGGFHLTRDVAAGLQVSFEEAVELILEYGISKNLIQTLSGDEEPASTDDQPAHIKLKSAVRGAPTIVERDTLDMIVFERTKELLTKVRQHLKARGHMRNLVRGIVLTGGAASIPNMPQMAEALFEVPARCGPPDGIENLHPVLNSPEFAPVAGVLRHGFEYRAAARSGRIETRRGLVGGVVHGVGNFFSKYFF